jgi:dTMP kinase
MIGRFVVIEGLDGAGTTTLTHRLSDRLTGVGIDNLVTREPSDLAVGRLIREALSNRLAISDGVLPFLFAADRKDHLEREVEPALFAGRWVISDRYLTSSLAYQSLSSPFESVAALNSQFRKPDLTLFVDTPASDCMARIEARGEETERFEQLDRLRVVAQAYDRALEWCISRGERVIRIDGRPDADAVAQMAWAEIAKLIEDTKSSHG